MIHDHCFENVRQFYRQLPWGPDLSIAAKIRVAPWTKVTMNTGRSDYDCRSPHVVGGLFARFFEEFLKLLQSTLPS